MLSDSGLVMIDVVYLTELVCDDDGAVDADVSEHVLRLSRR